MKKIFTGIILILIIHGIISMDKCLCAASKFSKLYDKSPVSLRLPDKYELDRIRKDKDFQYEKKTFSGNTIADIIGSWISWLREHFFSHIFSKEVMIFWRFFPYIIIAAALVIVVIALRRGGLFGLFSRKDSRAGSMRYNPEEDIHEIDFDSMMKKFMNAEDYRMVLRYRFLKTLKNMSVKGIIEWQKEKTNQDYLNEIPREARTSFENLVSIFEYVWYGSFDIERTFLDKMNERFYSFDLGMEAFAG